MKKYFKYLYIFSLVVFATHLKAQKNCISSEVRTGCIPFVAQIEYCGPLQEDNNPPPVIYRYGDGEQTSSTTHTYQSAGFFSVNQSIFYKPGVRLDSTFRNFFRVVDLPSFQVSITNCKDKNIQLSIDSNSYDFYEIKNSLNSSIDTLLGFGVINLSFSGETENEVVFSITGKYKDADCELSINMTHNLVNGISPSNISKVSEFNLASIDFTPILGINYTFSTIKDGLTVDSIVGKDKSNLSLINNQEYNQLLFKAEDDCQNTDTILFLESFKSRTIFESNKNTINQTSITPLSSTLDFLKLNNKDTIQLSSNIDSSIACGATDCYFIQTKDTQNEYIFIRHSTGNCGTSFSLDKPIIESIAIDNSNNTSSTLKINSNSNISVVTINDENFDEINNGNLTFDYTQECIDISITNSCGQTSLVNTKCPLKLSDNNGQLSWNNLTNDSHTLFWINTNGDTNTLAINLLSNYAFDSKNYVAQEFCLFVQNLNDNSKSNSLCFQDFPFIFIPELAFINDEELKIENKYLATFELQLYDLNGNLVKNWNQTSKLNIQNLDIGTYFYIFEGISENNTVLNTKGTILIKN